MEFVEAPLFTQLLRDYLNDDDYRRLQAALAENPEAGDVIPGSGGFRKIRWSDSRRQKGKRGGLRVIYFSFPDENQIWLVTLYGKGDVADLTAAEKRALKAAVEQEARRRAERRKTRRK